MEGPVIQRVMEKLLYKRFLFIFFIEKCKSENKPNS